MASCFRSGDRLAVVEFRGRPRPGWIVAIVSKGRHVTHRVVKVDGEKFWTRGDATPDLEGPYLPHEALGRVVGFWREGKYHRLDRRIDDLVGLASNHAQNRLRRLARRLPALKRAVAQKDLGHPALSALVVRLLGLAAGEIDVTHEELAAAPEREPVEMGGSWVFIARSRLGRMGEAVLDRVAALADPATGYVSGLSVHALFRRLGAGRALLGAIEKKARAKGIGRLGALVRKDNAASRALFESVGYRRVAPDEIARRDDLAELPAEMDLLEKMLGP